MRHLLGVEPDGVVAKKAGVTVEAVRMYRRRHGIEHKVVRTPTATVAPRRRRSALDPFIDLLGTVPDSEVAARANVTGENVRAFRRRHGIDADWPGARSRSKSTSTVVSGPAAVVGRKVLPQNTSNAVFGFLVTLREEGDHVVMAPDMTQAVSLAVAATSTEIIAIRSLGPLLV
jgi:hypothetical protein